MLRVFFGFEECWRPECTGSWQVGTVEEMGERSGEWALCITITSHADGTSCGAALEPRPRDRSGGAHSNVPPRRLGSIFRMRTRGSPG